MTFCLSNLVTHTGFAYTGVSIFLKSLLIYFCKLFHVINNNYKILNMMMYQIMIYFRIFAYESSINIGYQLIGN